MNPLPALAIDRVDRIEPRVQEQPERRRRATRPFPELDKEEHEPAEVPAAPRAPRTGDDDGEEHLIDLLVRARLPTRQFLPGSARAGLPN